MTRTATRAAVRAGIEARLVERLGARFTEMLRGAVLRERARAWQRVRAARARSFRAASGSLRIPPAGLPKGGRRRTLPPLREVARRQATWKTMPYLRREFGCSVPVRPPGTRQRWRRYGTYRSVIITTYRYRSGGRLAAAWPDVRPRVRRWRLAPAGPPAGTGDAR